VQIKGRQDGPLRVVGLSQGRAKYRHETPTGYIQQGTPMAVHLSVGVLAHHVHDVREGRQSGVCAQCYGMSQRTAQQGDQLLLPGRYGRRGGALGYAKRRGHLMVGAHLDSPHKAIPTSIDRLNEMRCAPIVTNGLSDSSESTLQGGVANMMTWPDLCTQFLPGDNAISMLQEIGKHA